jgi:hypothetical protein
MGKAERLQQFLSWAQATGVTTERVNELRPVAEALLDRSGGGRVTESHILYVTDVWVGRHGDEALALVTEAGELFLRFEEAQRAAGQAAPAPRRGLGTFLPGRAANAAAIAEDAVPDAPPPLRPPEKSTGSVAVPDEGPAISFRTPASAAPPAPLPLKAPPPSGGHAPPSRGPSAAPAPAPATASQFRCPACQVMVSPTPQGTCPRCGARPPHALTLPTAAPVPAAARVSAASRFAVLALAVLLAVGAGALAWRCSSAWSGGQKVSGETRIAALGVKAFFPRGWRRFTDADTSAGVGPVRMTMVGFYRGGSSGDPDVALLLGVIDGPLPGIQGNVVSDAEFQIMFRRMATDVARATNGSAQISSDACEVLQLGLRRTGRCTGTVNADGERQLAVYVWLQGRSAAMAVFIARWPLDRLLPEADDIVGSVEELEPVTTPAPSP